MTHPLRRAVLPLALLALAALAVRPAHAAEIFPLDQIKPGMKGTARTIFAGKEIESFDLEVIGVLRNLIGPKQDVILVRLLGEKTAYTGVVAGMSGSPVYIEGKLVGALAYRFGAFTREPIAGVTPIESMLRAAQEEPPPQSTAALGRYPLPEETSTALGLGHFSDRYLVPIETPLSFVGIHPRVVSRFSEELGRLGLLALQGGGTAVPENTSELLPGGAVAAALVTGDMGIAGTCTITHRIGNQLFACGHALLSYGDVQLPMARAEIVTTVASELSSFKIANLGELVGTFHQDRRSAIVGEVGPIPAMIPVDLTVAHRGRERQYHYQIFQHPKLSPTLLNLTLFNGLFTLIESGEGLTYRVSGQMSLRGHESIVLDDMFGPTESPFPDALLVAGSVGQTFRRIFSNPFETPEIERITLRVELLPERRAVSIENAWVDKNDVRPGETIHVKVVLRPYRGPRLVREIPIEIPPQAAKGNLRVLVSDALLLNRITRTMQLSFGLRLGRQLAPRVSSLEQLIALINRERRNDRLYVSLFQRTPTLLVEDKVLPSIPLSQMNVLNPRQTPGRTIVSYQSILNESSQPLGQVITGSRWLQVTVR